MKQQLSMRTTSILLSHFIFFINLKAQNTNSQDSYTSQDSVTNFQPSVAVVIGMLSVVFFVTFVLLLYAKFCHRQYSPGSGAAAEQTQDWLIPSRPNIASGIEKTVIESLPFFRFSLLKGSREGLECAVCLSKFDDIEILRLLPKCKHAFHVDCIDHWLEKHSSCPLCRQKVGINDLSQMAYSNSFRFLWNRTESREEASLEVYVQREEDHFGSSRSRFEKGKNSKEDIVMEAAQESMDLEDQNKKTLHRFNHKIVVSDAAAVMIKNRWSNVSPSDIMSLKSEMINDATSSKFTTFPDPGNDHIRITNIQQEMGKGSLEFDRNLNKENYDNSFGFPGLPTTSDSYKQNHENSGFDSKVVSNTDSKRSMSEIIARPRSVEFIDVRDHSSVLTTNAKEERMRRLWLSIARKTVHRLANRETKAPRLQGSSTNITL